MGSATAPSTQIRRQPEAGGPEAEETRSSKESGSGPAGDSRRERIPGARHIESPEDLLHVAVGVLATVALFWLIRRGPRFPGF